jgi:3-oxoacyl-[acyl-carrier protein] reductase
VRFDFADQTVVVTGAAQGIGRAVSARFVEAGASVWMLDPDRDLLAESARAVGGLALPADVASTAEVDAAVSRVVASDGRVDVLFNNTGLLRDRMSWKLSDGGLGCCRGGKPRRHLPAHAASPNPTRSLLLSCSWLRPTLAT